MTFIEINGVRIEAPNGASVSVNNNRIFINGKPVTEELKGIVEVRWEGSVASLECEAPVVISGDAHGDVQCNTATIKGAVRGSVKGNVIHCGTVGGSVKGNVVNHR